MVGFRYPLKEELIGNSTLDSGVALHHNQEGHWFEEVENSLYMLTVMCG